MVRRAGLLNGDKPALSEMQNKSMVTYSCINILEDMNALGTALIDLGLEGKHIDLLGENSYNWFISYLAIICGVGVVIPLDKELTTITVNF
jgi:long-chain acyl-CoA synthetase